MEIGISCLVNGSLQLVLMFVFFSCVFSHQNTFNYIHNMRISQQRLKYTNKCADTCIFTLVESFPENLTYKNAGPAVLSTYLAHKRLLAQAKEKIHLASFYWTLTDLDTIAPDNTSFEGHDIFKDLENIVKGGKIEVKIAQNNTNNETDRLAADGAQVRTLDFPHLVNAGVMHTKMWIVDGMHVYIGSGNFDWRSYTQIKEVGVLIENCPCLGADAEKLFEVYWYLGANNATVPDIWPPEYETDINTTSPLLVHYNDTKGLVYFSSSPSALCPFGRTKDLDAVINVIRSAKKFIYISVMDYEPMFIFSNPRKFWPKIDNELRAAAIDRNIIVFLMASRWNHTEAFMLNFLKSLSDLNGAPKLNVTFRVKLFYVPSTPEQQNIPYARVSHSKYMVTDQHAYIGTSNWAGDYFNNTGGVAFILEQPDDGSNGTNLRTQLVNVFEHDWYSEHANYIN